MRLIIEARLADGDSDTVNDGDGVLAVVERRDCSLAQLGLTLAEGRSLLPRGGDVCARACSFIASVASR
jgi:hypothetical protein